MDCKYKEFLLCDLCPIVNECVSNLRVVSSDYNCDKCEHKECFDCPISKVGDNI